MSSPEGDGEPRALLSLSLVPDDCPPPPAAPSELVPQLDWDPRLVRIPGRGTSPAAAALCAPLGCSVTPSPSRSRSPAGGASEPPAYLPQPQDDAPPALAGGIVSPVGTALPLPMPLRRHRPVGEPIDKPAEGAAATPAPEERPTGRGADVLENCLNAVAELQREAEGRAAAYGIEEDDGDDDTGPAAVTHSTAEGDLLEAPTTPPAAHHSTPRRRLPRVATLPTKSPSPRPRYMPTRRSSSAGGRSPSHPLSTGLPSCGPLLHSPPRTYRVDEDGGFGRRAEDRSADPYGFLSSLVAPMESMHLAEPCLSPRQKTMYQLKHGKYMKFERRALVTQQTYLRVSIAAEHADGLAKLKARLDAGFAKLNPKTHTIAPTQLLLGMVEGFEARARHDVAAIEAAERRMLVQAMKGDDALFDGGEGSPGQLSAWMQRRWSARADRIRAEEQAARAVVVQAFLPAQQRLDRLELCVATEQTKRTFLTALEGVVRDAACREHLHKKRKIATWRHTLYDVFLPQEAHTRRLLIACEALHRRYIQSAFDTFAAVRRHAGKHGRDAAYPAVPGASLFASLSATLSSHLTAVSASATAYSPAARPASPPHRAGGAVHHKEVTPMRLPLRRADPQTATPPLAAQIPRVESTATKGSSVPHTATPPLHAKAGHEERCPHGVRGGRAAALGGRVVAVEALIPPEICAADGEEVLPPQVVEPPMFRRAPPPAPSSTATPDEYDTLRAAGTEEAAEEQPSEACDGPLMNQMPDTLRDIYQTALRGLLGDMQHAFQASEAVERERVVVEYTRASHDLALLEADVRSTRRTARALFDGEARGRAALEQSFLDVRAERCGAFMLQQFCCCAVDEHLALMNDAIGMDARQQTMKTWSYREFERLLTVEQEAAHARHAVAEEEAAAWDELADVFAMFAQRFSHGHQLRVAMDTEAKERRAVEWHEVALRNALHQYLQDVADRSAEKAALREAIDREDEVYRTPALREPSPELRVHTLTAAHSPPQVAPPPPRPPPSPATEGEVRGLMDRLGRATQQLRGKVEARGRSASCQLSPAGWTSPVRDMALQDFDGTAATPPPPSYAGTPTPSPHPTPHQLRLLRAFSDVCELYDDTLFPSPLNDAFHSAAAAVRGRHAVDAHEERAVRSVAAQLLSVFRDGRAPLGGYTPQQRQLHALLMQLENDWRLG